jgi:hypothetical protein
MCEDTLITALRGGEGGINVAMARGHIDVPQGEPASWHLKVVDKTTMRGKIFIGVETCPEGGDHIRMGQDWYDETCAGRALYYRFVPKCRLKADGHAHVCSCLLFCVGHHPTHQQQHLGFL